MTSSPEFLFVYGTLRSAATGSKGRAQRDRLARAARVVGAARVPGRIFDLGLYPGLVLGGEEHETVHGEILSLSPPTARTLGWLDDYEGIVPGDHPHNEYERRLLDAVLDSGETVRAWAYVYLRNPPATGWIRSGDWLSR